VAKRFAANKKAETAQNKIDINPFFFMLFQLSRQDHSTQ
jgi:hypothetical protein